MFRVARTAYSVSIVAFSLSFISVVRKMENRCFFYLFGRTSRTLMRRVGEGKQRLVLQVYPLWCC